MQADECTDNKVCKLFTLTGGTVTWSDVSDSLGKQSENIEYLCSE